MVVTIVVVSKEYLFFLLFPRNFNFSQVISVISVKCAISRPDSGSCQEETTGYRRAMIRRLRRLRYLVVKTKMLVHITKSDPKLTRTASPSFLM